jgi:acetyltransferase-like isoleucine patch superfamily enzyme
MLNALETPWKIANWLSSRLIHPYVYVLFKLNRIPWRKGWHFFGVPIIQKHRNSLMSFGAGLQLRSSVRSNPLGPNRPVILATWKENAVLEVGQNFAMTGGTLCAFNRITIGDDVALGANTTIVDTDFHPLDPEYRLSNPTDAKTARVLIGDNVFIGMNCLILKGATIGCGSVVGAGSVVTHNVPPRVIVGGNPARILKEL